MNITENTFRTEQFAKDTRRELINLGINVSLIAYDPSREVYVFDIISD